MAPDRSILIRTLDVASVAAFAILSGALALRLWSMPAGSMQQLGLLAGAIVGYLVADVVSGVVHWFCDTFFREDTPVLGRAFIRPFREHHVDPLAITRHGFFEVNGNNCLVLVPLLIAALVLGQPDSDGSVPAPFWQSVTLALAAATFATNQIHKWAHQQRPAAPVRWLQASGLVLSPSHHARHHTAPHRQAYCITAGWLDPLLDRARLFERIERAADAWLARSRPKQLAAPSLTGRRAVSSSASRR